MIPSLIGMFLYLAAWACPTKRTHGEMAKFSELVSLLKPSRSRIRGASHGVKGTKFDLHRIFWGGGVSFVCFLFLLLFSWTPVPEV